MSDSTIQQELQHLYRQTSNQTTVFPETRHLTQRNSVDPTRPATGRNKRFLAQRGEGTKLPNTP